MGKHKSTILLSILGFFYILFFSNCRNKDESPRIDYGTPRSGQIHISVDESFEPVIKEQIKVYESSYPDAHIIASYKSEADCFRDLDNDSVRLVIVAKGLTPEQSKHFDDRLSFKPQFDIVAFDAVSAIININERDSLFTLERLKNILTGSDTSFRVVLDGTNATSTVRFLQDSMLAGGNFGSNVMAADDSKGVIDFISNNKKAIGFVGSSWVVDEDDPAVMAYQQKIKFALLQCKFNCDSATYAKPSQTTISYYQYPLVRPLYYILKENLTGLGSGFTNFLSLERGQLIFNRSYLVPAKINFGSRKSLIH